MVDRAVMALIDEWSRESGIHPDLISSIVAGESNFDPMAVGDFGTSAGLIQMHVPAHGHDLAWWQGIEGGRRAWEEMKGRWVSALRGFPDAAEQWAGPNAVDFFARAWAAMQGADLAFCRQHAPAAVQAGRAAWDAYRRETPPPTPPPPDDLGAQVRAELRAHALAQATAAGQIMAEAKGIADRAADLLRKVQG